MHKNKLKVIDDKDYLRGQSGFYAEECFMVLYGEIELGRIVKVYAWKIPNSQEYDYFEPEYNIFPNDETINLKFSEYDRYKRTMVYKRFDSVQHALDSLYNRHEEIEEFYSLARQPNFKLSFDEQPIADFWSLENKSFYLKFNNIRFGRVVVTKFTSNSRLVKSPHSSKRYRTSDTKKGEIVAESDFYIENRQKSEYGKKTVEDFDEAIIYIENQFKALAERYFSVKKGLFW